MSGLPTSLAGLSGFLIFVVFIVGITVPNLNTAESQNVRDLQDQVIARMNSSVNSSTTSAPSGFWGLVTNAFGVDGIYDFLIGFFQIIISVIQLVIAYLFEFFKAFVELPSVFIVIFLILTSSIIIAIIKLIFLNGD